MAIDGASQFPELAAASDRAGTWKLLGRATLTWARLFAAGARPGAGPMAEGFAGLAADLKAPLDTLVRVAGDAAAASSLRRGFEGDEQMTAVRLLRERVLGILMPLSMKVADQAEAHTEVRDFCQVLLAAASGMPLQAMPLPPEVSEHVTFAAYELAPLDHRPLASALEVSVEERAARDGLAAALARIQAQLEHRLPAGEVASFFPPLPSGAGEAP